MRAWGGPGQGYEWPLLEHGLYVDYKGNVWISGNAGKGWGRILKFTADGKFLMSIGQPLPAGEEPSNNSTTVLGNQPADMFVDPKTNDLYLADGDGGDRRVIVFDAETGAFRRLWGAYGEKPAEGKAAKYDPSAPPSKSFSAGVHCVLVGNDGLVYVCDRNADRIQIFHPDGTFVKEAFVSRETFGNGTMFDLAFTPDEKYMYVADGANQKVWIMQRDSLEIVGSFGQLGHGAGEFRNLHGINRGLERQRLYRRSQRRKARAEVRAERERKESLPPIRCLLRVSSYSYAGGIWGTSHYRFGRKPKWGLIPTLAKHESRVRGLFHGTLRRANLHESSRGAVEALLEVHESQQGGQDAFLQVIRQPGAPGSDVRQLQRRRLHVLLNFAPSSQVGAFHGSLTPHDGAGALDADHEVLNADSLRLELAGDRGLAPSKATTRGSGRCHWTFSSSLAYEHALYQKHRSQIAAKSVTLA